MKLYLGEYIGEDAIMELQEDFVSIGQKLGFVSAGDARRAREKAAAESALLRAAEAFLRDGDPVDRVARVLKLPLETVQAIADRIAKPA